jgi:predicted lipoprotein
MSADDVDFGAALQPAPVPAPLKGPDDGFKDLYQAITLTQDFTFHIAQWKGDLALIDAAIDDMLEVAEVLEIANANGYAQAVTLISSAKKIAKRIDSSKKPILEVPKAIVATVNNFARVYTDRLAAVEKTLKAKMLAYQQEQARRRAEAEAKAQAQADALMQQAREQGMEGVAVIAPVTPAPATTVRTEAGSAYVRKEVDFEVEDLEKVPREYLMLDEKKVRAAVKAGVTIPGIKTITKDVLVTRPA